MIDQIDRQIVTLLQDDARLSNAALAESVGLTVSTVHERVKKLEKKGVIKGYVAQVDAAALGKAITAFIRLTVGASAESFVENKKSIAYLCRDTPEILECHHVAGEDCYVLKVRVASPKELEKLLEYIRCNARVQRSVTSIVLSTLKESSKVTPLDVEND
jgi:Lrp/AsnC family leucine-responsive transcriptional regulator